MGRRGNGCRVCGSTELGMFLDLGEKPPAHAPLPKEELGLPEARYPLALSSCCKCELIQLTHVLAPELLFRPYVYFSSVSEAMTRHFSAYAWVVADRSLPETGLVVEFGAHDGILLRSLL